MVKNLLTLCTLTTPLPSRSPVCCPCVKASVLLALGPLPPGCPPMPVPFLAGTSQPYAGSCGGPRMGEPPSCACGQLCRAACCASAPVHAPCPSPLGEGLEGHLSTPRASLLALCTGGGCLWGECCSCRQGAGCLDCPGRRPAQTLAEAALLVHGICVQVLWATRWTLRAEAKVRLLEDQKGWEGWACRSPAEVRLAVRVLVDYPLGILGPCTGWAVLYGCWLPALLSLSPHALSRARAISWLVSF